MQSKQQASQGGSHLVKPACVPRGFKCPSRLARFKPAAAAREEAAIKAGLHCKENDSATQKDHLHQQGEEYQLACQSGEGSAAREANWKENVSSITLPQETRGIWTYSLCTRSIYHCSLLTVQQILSNDLHYERQKARLMPTLNHFMHFISALDRLDFNSWHIACFSWL